MDGKRLVSSDGNALYLWRLDESGSWDYERSLPFRSASFPIFVPNINNIALRDKNNLLKIISLEDGKEVATLPCSARTNCAFSPDQHWLVTGDAKRNILLWDLFTYQYSLIPVRFPRFRDDPWENETTLAHETVRSLQFTSDGQRLIFLASSAEGDLHICHFDPVYKHLMRQKTFPHGSVDLALSPNGKMLATIVVEPGRGPVQDIYVYDLESFQLLHIFPQIDEDCYCLLAFSPDRQCLTSCKDNGLVDIFSLDSFDRIASFATHPGLSSHATDPIGGLDWSKTGFIATGGASVFDDVFLDRPDYTIKIWKVE